MLEAIEKLLILQDRDRKIRQVRGELAHIEPERQALKTKGNQAQTALETAKNKLRQNESDRKTLELEIEAKKELIIRYANQQLQTRKNEEYRALTHQIDTCKGEIFQIENREIELMEQAEAAQKELARASQAAEEARKLVESQLSQLAGREKSLQQELAQLEANREELASAVDEVSRARYERLSRSKGENVVVGVQHGVCGGCHMRLPAQIVVSCQGQQELVSCTNCGRILYYTPDMDLAVAE
ncbi:MAG TPA: C4-type zinc ribbon domain-containing protein [Candidatus Sulfotelmatobacter sp.]|nr:C4-type zinc ribbon domain-containing protein [Candidatus Sulfotelmatobacter sp.]